MNIYTNRAETIEASDFIHSNLLSSFIGSKGDNNYYNVKGIVWEIWVTIYIFTPPPKKITG